MDLIRAHLFDIVAQGQPMTVRQVFYQATVRRVVAKTEGECKRTVGRLLTEMRLNGELQYGWIADNTRWMRKPTTYGSMEAALENTARTYRRQLWANQGAYVEIWLEKDALAGVVVDLTAEFDVPLMVTRGYPSLSFLHEAAEAIDAASGLSTILDGDQWWKPCKDVFVYYFGDHDPSGVDIPRNVEDRLSEFAAADIHFERVAVTEDQIEEFRLPTRPTKRSDSRARDWVGGSVELDAIPPDVLRELVLSCIEPHIDRAQLARLQTIEAEEREVLRRLMSREFVDLARNGNRASP